MHECLTRPIAIRAILLAFIVLATEIGRESYANEPERSVSLTVMSFNILQGGGNAANVGFPDADFGGSRLDEIAAVIVQGDADIVGVQECGNVARLVQQLGPGWHGVGTGRSGYTSGIVSKLPIEELIVEDFVIVVRMTLQKHPDGEDSGEARSRPTSLIVASAHWSPSRYGPDMVQQRLREGTIPDDVGAFGHEIVEAASRIGGPRGYQTTIDVLRAHLQNGEDVVLVGDFNEPSHLDWTERAAQRGMDRWVRNPTGRPLRFPITWEGSMRLAALGLRDAYRTAWPDEVAKPGITWTPPYPAGTPGRRPYDDQVLDRIDLVYFAGPHLQLNSAAVIGESIDHCETQSAVRWPSDHRAVVTTLKLQHEPSSTDK